MKKLSRILSVFLIAVTLVLLFDVLPATVFAAGVDAPEVSISNVADSGKIRLTWDAVEDAVKYRVYRSTSKNGTYARCCTTTKTAYTNTSTKAGTQYYYFVRAYAADGTYTDSKRVTRTCDLPRPVVVAGNLSSSGYPKLSWDKVDGAVSYKVYRAESKNGTYKLMKTTTSTAYTNTSAKPGITYYYKVVAVAKKSAANSAATLKSRTCDLARPKVTIDLDGSGKPLLTWQTVKGATGYKVYRATSQSGSYSLIDTVTTATYTNTDAQSGVTYYYKVRAVCGVDSAASAYSTVCSIQTAAESSSDSVYVNQNSVYIYKSTSSSSKSLKLPYMTELKLGKAVTSGSSGKWYEIYYQDARYYIWITPDSDKLTTVPSELIYTGNHQYQQEIFDLALTIYREWDTDYRSGETGDVHSDGSVGFDCSGFASYVINTVMQRYNPVYRLTPNLRDMYKICDLYNTGLQGEFKAIDVELEDAQPGDVLFFKDSSTGKLSHCGLYMGNGEFLHSTTTWDGVALSPLPGSYMDRLIGIKRFVPEEVVSADTVHYLTTGCKVYEDRKCSGNVIKTLKRGSEVTVLFAMNKADGSPFTAYVRTSDGTYGFMWLKYLSTTK